MARAEIPGAARKADPAAAKAADGEKERGETIKPGGAKMDDFGKEHMQRNMVADRLTRDGRLAFVEYGYVMEFPNGNCGFDADPRVVSLDRPVFEAIRIGNVIYVKHGAKSLNGNKGGEDEG